MSAALEPFSRALFESLEPLEEALTEPRRLAILLRQLGFAVHFEPGTLEGLVGPLGPLAQDATGALRVGRPALERLRDSATPAASRVEAVLTLLDAARDLVGVAKALGPAIAATDLSAMPGALRDRTTWTTDIAPALPGFLLVSWLEANQPALFEALRFVGIVDEVANRLHLRAVGDLLDDPVATLKARFESEEAGEWVAERLLRLLADFFGAAGLPTRLAPVGSELRAELFGSTEPAGMVELPLVEGFLPGGHASFGLVVLPVPRSSGEPSSGLLVGMLAEGEFAHTLPLDEAGYWTLDIAAGFEATAALGVQIHPSGIVPRAGMPAAGAGLVVTFDPPEGWRLIGAPTGSRIEIRGLQTSLDLSLDDVVWRLRTVVRGAEPGFAIILAPREGDSFVAGLLGSLDLTAALDVDLRWSARDGLTVGGSAGLSVTRYLGTRIGPLQLDSIQASARRGDHGGLAAAAAANLTVALGPLIITFEGVGIDFQLDEASNHDGNVGPLDVRVGFEPPSVVGVGIDLPVAQGGGFLRVDPENGRYEGVLDIALARVGITAIVLVTTRLPDGSDGWSMFASLQAAFTGIPLGFGFTLTGVGGLVGVHRGLDAEAMGEGLRQGVLDSLLFPEDPIRDAPRILRDMNAIFPVKPGQFVFGPVLSISWGAASVFELELGVVLQLPTPFSISLLGSFSAVLPTEDEPILVLRVDVVGTLDFSAGTIRIDASLRDSRVLALELTGDMAVRASFVHSPGFLISFGGFHPEFEAPEGFPNLRRLGVALDTGDNLRITMGAYFALTTNTLQFGAAYELWASVLGFTAEGGASFDALIQFEPFGFLVSVRLWVTLRGPAVELGVSFRGDLAGPNPWFITGQATFKILGVRQSFEISATIGKERPDPPPKSVDVRGLVLDDLARPEAWTAISPAQQGGVLVTEGPDDELQVHPAGFVEIRQRIAPLDIRLERYGPSEIEGPDRLRLRLPQIGSVSLSERSEPVYDHFATAQFFQLDDDERLSAPSFEMMVAGLRMGELPLAAGSERSYVYNHEDRYRDPAGATDDHGRSGGISATPAAALDHARALDPTVTVPRGMFRVRAQTFVATEVHTGSRSPLTRAEGMSYFGARATLLRAEDRARRVLVPAYELALSGDADRE